MGKEDRGTISGWNEGELKNLRLHEIQSAINYYKSAHLDKNEHGIYNFESWFNQILCLYDEGNSKYGKEEIELVDKMIKVIENTMESFPVFKTAVINGYGSEKHIEKLQRENWKVLLSLLRIFEKKVRKLNDEHGFGTRNVEDFDEGL